MYTDKDIKEMAEKLTEDEKQIIFFGLKRLKLIHAKNRLLKVSVQFAKIASVFALVLYCFFFSFPTTGSKNLGMFVETTVKNDGMIGMDMTNTGMTESAAWRKAYKNSGVKLPHLNLPQYFGDGKITTAKGSVMVRLEDLSIDVERGKDIQILDNSEIVMIGSIKVPAYITYTPDTYRAEFIYNECAYRVEMDKDSINIEDFKKTIQIIYF